MTRTVAVVPAAGKGERFAAGSAPGLPAKLLTLIDGTPLIARTVRALLDGGVDECIVVASVASADAIAAVLGQAEAGLIPTDLTPRQRVRIVRNPDPSRGMFSSIQCGVAAADTDADLYLVLPGDMPFVRPQTVTTILDAARRSGYIVSPSFHGRRGHPVALPARLRDLVLNAAADDTLSTVLSGEASLRVEVNVTDQGILRDVDTAEDLA